MDAVYGHKFALEHYGVDACCFFFQLSFYGVNRFVRSFYLDISNKFALGEESLVSRFFNSGDFKCKARAFICYHCHANYT